MRLTLCEVTNSETRPDHNIASYDCALLFVIVLA